MTACGGVLEDNASAAVQLIKQAEGKLVIEATEINWGATVSAAYDPPERWGSIAEESQMIVNRDAPWMMNMTMTKRMTSIDHH